jgi:TRAP-type C4-dicarboxylate transport system substrate-binding protein
MRTKKQVIEQRKKWREQEAKAIEACKQRMVEETCMDRNHPKFERVWSMAWDNGHASGLNEVEMHFRELAELIMS